MPTEQRPRQRMLANQPTEASNSAQIKTNVQNWLLGIGFREQVANQQLNSGFIRRSRVSKSLHPIILFADACLASLAKNRAAT